MATRIVTLNASAAGMTRLRGKGGASPQTLYELTNGYVSASRAPTQRPGTTWKFNFADPAPVIGTSSSNFLIALGAISFTMDATVSGTLVGQTLRATSRASGAYMQGNVTGASGTTITITITSDSGSGIHSDWTLTTATSYAANAGLSKGLVAFKGVLYAFCHKPLTTSSASFVILTLRHPTSSTATLTKIHFAQPFMGFMYVVAEFSDAFIGHYWLQTPPAWTVNMGYKSNDLVQPTTPNGFYYKAVQVANPPTWTPLIQYALNDFIQPTKYNGYQYKAFNEIGPNTPPARSGSIEPIWQVATGNYAGRAAVTFEFSTSAPLPVPTAAAAPPANTPPGREPGGRYDNRYGHRFSAR